MTALLKTTALAALLSLSFAVAPALAAGESSDDTKAADELTPKQVAAKKECEKDGKVWDKVKKVCADPQEGSLDDESLYEAGRLLAKAGRYDEAITTLNYVSNPRDKRVLNYLGYSYRKSGQIDVGLTYYRQALEIDPNYTLVREYLGEALIQMGDISGAKGQLLEIKARCGGECPEYTELAKQLSAYN
jgi:tetratricopeptide (TPR) repeat protein